MDDKLKADIIDILSKKYEAKSLKYKGWTTIDDNEYMIASIELADGTYKEAYVPGFIDEVKDFLIKNQL